LGLLLLLEYIGFSGAVNTVWYICYLFNADQSNDHVQVGRAKKSPFFGD